MANIRDAVDAVIAAIMAQKDYLTAVDAKTGDGDHGLNMARGFTAAEERLAELPPDAPVSDVLHHIALYYFGSFGSILLGITITCACLKTAIGLVTACSTTFAELFPHSLTYPKYAILFALFSFAFSNVGLSKIIAYSLPVLYLLYPIAIVLIALCLIEGAIGYHRPLYVCTMIGTCAAASFDFLRALPSGVQEALPAMELLRALGDALPLAHIGMGWTIPALVGLVIGALVLLLQRRAS